MKNNTVFKLSAITVTLLLSISPIGQSLYNRFCYTHNSHSLWQEVAKHYGFQYSSHSAPIHKAILQYTKNQDYLDQLTHNARFYLFYVYQQTKLKHLPSEIALIPMIESDYNPFIYSHQGATGLWQMMPQTASGFGLHINWWYDGRRDIVKSTAVALKYLEDLHQHYHNDWLLAIAAYDAGQGKVDSAIAKNQREHKSTNFWSLSLPEETKLYVPRLLALAAIIKNPEKYHVHIKHVENSPYFKTLTVHRPLEISEIAKVCETDINLIRELNPGFRRWTTQPSDDNTLVLPVNKVKRFTQQLNNLKHPPEHARSGGAVITTPLHHKVRHGESLKTLASHYHTTVIAIKKENHLAKNHIKLGDNLLIPAKPSHAISKQAVPKKVAEDNIPGPKRIIHVVKKHDSLPKIASLYDVNLEDLRFWNGFKDEHSQLHSGQELVIWKKHYPILASEKSFDPN